MKKQFSPEGFEWISHQDGENSMIVYLRKGSAKHKHTTGSL